jgi:hypothetical protein
MFSQDHVKLWSAERLVSAALIPATILPLVYTTPATDALFCTLAVLHSHWGIEVNYLFIETLDFCPYFDVFEFNS